VTTPNIAPQHRTTTQDVAGQDVVLAYANVRDEYEALRSRAIVVDRSHRGRIRFIGEKAGDALTGLVTNDVLAIAPGQGRYGAALTSKGKIVADLRIYAMETGYLADTSARAWPGWFSMVKKYVNPRVAGYRDESHAIRDIGIFGPNAPAIVAAVSGIEQGVLAELAPLAHVTTTRDGASITVARAIDLGGDGFDLFVPFEIHERIWSDAVAVGATPAGLGAWEIARVEAGRPEWGIDIDESTLPQEANFDELDAISYTKGCYIGQEVVARVHFRGHVNRHLRALRAQGGEAPPTGTQLFDDAGNNVGEVRSSVSSPRFGGIAIGMVRREVTPGSRLVARWDGGEQTVDVGLLPFTT
jgi:folate-binding protein YgfZ